MNQTVDATAAIRSMPPAPGGRRWRYRHPVNPSIFLNLAFSTQAAYAAPLILLASNRAAIRDRLTLEHAAKQTDVEEGQNERLLQGMTDILRHVQTVEEQILGLEQRILELEQGIVTRLDVPTDVGGSDIA